jgi:hypothetical protein
MALIVEYHVVADMYPVGTTAITAGMIVSITAGLVVPANSSLDPDSEAIGIAGDSKLSAEGQTTAYSDQVRIGANNGTSRYTENRVSDFYDETLASQKITVYNGGGKFWISNGLFDNDGASCVAGLLVGIGTVAGEWKDTASTDDDIIGLCVGASQAYPSGVPGTDVTGSITLGNFVPIVLRI